MSREYWNTGFDGVHGGCVDDSTGILWHVFVDRKALNFYVLFRKKFIFNAQGMIFNSYSFILIFLPLVVAVYFFISKHFSSRYSRLFLIAASLFFISVWNVYFSILLIVSILFNYALGLFLSATNGSSNAGRRKTVFLIAIAGNILFLGFFKYSNFFLGTINSFFSTNLSLLNLMIPIGISFYTFMQIAWLTDIYRKGGFRYDFISYCCYVTFFPYVISGPIAYHHEVIPQLQSDKLHHPDPDNLCRGLFIFSIGLIKKTMIADTLALIANGGFESSASLTLIEAWLTSLSYTMQLYFDFSAYTDMAIGIALFFNINIPANFNSPYKSMDIREFWRRWHITLSRFLRDYIYIPLGGNRHGEIRTLTSLMLTFLIGGLWHGAAWTFVFWGFLHGLALVVHRLWMKTGFHLNKVVAWFITFNVLNIAWVFFRAESWEKALKILKGMAGINGILISPTLASHPFWQKMTAIGIRFGSWRANLPDADTDIYFLCILLIPFVLMTKNSNELLVRFKPNWISALAVSVMMIVGLLLLNDTSSFVYFKF